MENQQIPSGDESDRSSGASDIPGGNTENQTENSKSVAWETYAKTVNQEKNARARAAELEKRLAEFEAEKTKAEEAKLAEQGEYKKILEQREKQLAEANTRLTELQTNVLNQVKLNAFVDKLPGKIKKREYMSFIPLDEIALDPETNEIDESTVNDAVNKYVTEFPDLIQVASTKTLPSDSAQRSKGLTYEAWLKLPADQKRKRIGDVVNE